MLFRDRSAELATLTNKIELLSRKFEKQASTIVELQKDRRDSAAKISELEVRLANEERAHRESDTKATDVIAKLTRENAAHKRDLLGILRAAGKLETASTALAPGPDKQKIPPVLEKLEPTSPQEQINQSTPVCFKLGFLQICGDSKNLQ